jgi:hypothetical protein
MNRIRHRSIGPGLNIQLPSVHGYTLRAPPTAATAIATTDEDRRGDRTRAVAGHRNSKGGWFDRCSSGISRILHNASAIGGTASYRMPTPDVELSGQPCGPGGTDARRPEADPKLASCAVCERIYFPRRRLNSNENDRLTLATRVLRCAERGRNKAPIAVGRQARRPVVPVSPGDLLHTSHTVGRSTISAETCVASESITAGA